MEDLQVWDYLDVILPERQNAKHVWIVDPTKHTSEEIKYFTLKDSRLIPNKQGERFISSRYLTIQLL